MQHNVISDVKDVTVGWLTAVLHTTPALTLGTVTAININEGHGNWSTNAKLTVTYSTDAQGTLPTHLFLKISAADPDEEDAFGLSELAYYTQDYLDVPDAPLLTCYYGAYAESAKQYSLLLDDVSATHTVAANKEPTLTYGLALAEGLAALHARWWGADKLAQANAPIHQANFIQRFVDMGRPGVDHIINHDPPELHNRWYDTMRDLYVRHPQAIIQRTQDANGFTLIHGDVGHHNILIPRQGDRPLYIIDRQPFNWSLTTWLGAYDLAYAIILDWPTDSRRQHEIPVLKHYHQHLIQHGVVNYTWQQLFDDYRLCVAMGVYIATEYCRGGVNKRWFHVWLEMLRRSLVACDDLKCHELW